MKSLIALLLLTVTACGGTKSQSRTEYSLTTAGTGAAFAGGHSLLLAGERVVDSSVLAQPGGGYSVYYDYEDGRKFASIEVNRSGREGLSQASPGGENFTYVLRVGALLYKFGCAGATDGGDVFLSVSTDGRSWRRINGGLPVLRRDPDPNSDWHYLWNVGADVDERGVWHLLVECSDGTPGQAHVGLCYATAGLAGESITFTHAQEKQVIAHGGQPYVKYLPGQGLLVVHGSSNNPDGVFGKEWYVTASTLPIGVNQFTEHKTFKVGVPGVHVADPHLAELSDGRLLMVMSVDQTYVHATYASGVTFAGLFDTLRSTP